MTASPALEADSLWDGVVEDDIPDVWRNGVKLTLEDMKRGDAEVQAYLATLSQALVAQH